MASATIVLVPTIVLGELHAGFELGRRGEENLAALRQFLAEPFVRVLTPTVDVARGYGMILSQLRRAGTPIPTNDIWIAACAVDAGATLLTADRHFALVAGLAVATLDG